MIEFSTRLQKFKSKGEKTGWTYIEIPRALADKLQPGNKTSFRVKGKIDSYTLKQVAMIPMGNGDFIIPVNATMRRSMQKQVGDSVKVSLSVDKSPLQMSSDFMVCLEDDPRARETFLKQPPSHQRYFSNWIESAKTEETKAKRIAQSLEGLALGFNYGEMIRYFKGKKL